MTAQHKSNFILNVNPLIGAQKMGHTFPGASVPHNPAETERLLIEFGTLSKLTRKPVFYDKAIRAAGETSNRRSSLGLVGTRINS